MYGYSDYDGPSISTCDTNKTSQPGNDHTEILGNINDINNDGDEEEQNPLRAGLWMEGDSLAPPCGSSISAVHAMLDLADVRPDDILYDLGCGDGRICLEASSYKQCRVCVGVEIEEDLVERFQQLISRLCLGGDRDERHLVACKGEEQDDGSSGERIIKAVHGDLQEVLKSLVEIALDSTDAESGDKRGSFSHLPLPSVICLYLLPTSIELIQPHLMKLLELDRKNFLSGRSEDLRPKLRICCMAWGLKHGMKPILTSELMNQDGQVTMMVYDHTSLPVAH